jgi:hypothetical protein
VLFGAFGTAREPGKGTPQLAKSYNEATAPCSRRRSRSSSCRATAWR